MAPSSLELNGLVDTLASKLMACEQVHCPVTNHFDERGVYMREVFMPAGSFIIGKQHKTDNYNIMLSGRISVLVDGEIRHLKAPCVFMAKAGGRKVAYIHEDVRWINVHPTFETDLDKLEDMLIEKKPQNESIYLEMEQLQNALEQSTEELK
jgi:hypothetical protein